jgi:uncharacterized protein YceH (UPF0502 family)
VSDASTARNWTPLTPRERRVLGVLIEKQKTTPDAYPMTLAALVAGCNQKSNRDPVTQYEAEDIEETLDSLRRKGAAVLVEGSGRVLKWKHAAYDWLGLKGRPVETAILAELMLRGPQTEGELRQRASRMDEIADLPALQTSLAYLSELGLVQFLSPPGQKRGVVVSHGLYPADEQDRVRTAAARQPFDNGVEASVSSAKMEGGSSFAEELTALKQEFANLQEQFQRLSAEIASLKQALGS